MGYAKESKHLLTRGRTPFVRCPIAIELDRVDKGDREALQELLAAPQVTNKALADLISSERGDAINVEAVARHRRGLRGSASNYRSTCACFSHTVEEATR